MYFIHKAHQRKEKQSAQSHIRKPAPAQHRLQIVPHLHHAVVPAPGRHLGPLGGAQLVPPRQHGAVDNRPAGRGGLDAHDAGHAAAALGRAVRARVQAAVRDERRQQLVCDGQEAPVGRLGERRQGGEGAGRGGEQEDVWLGRGC